MSYKHIAYHNYSPSFLSQHKFEEAYRKTLLQPEIPSWVSDLLRSPSEQATIQQLYNSIYDQCTTTSPKAYTQHFDSLQKSYKTFQSYLYSINHPQAQNFTRHPLLIHFCRALIPAIRHPLITLSMLQNKTKDTDFQKKLDSIYDTLTIFVMINMLMDDCADSLQNKQLVNSIVNVLQNHSLNRLLTPILKLKNPLKRNAYKDFITLAFKLYQQAKEILQENFGTLDIIQNKRVLSSLKSVIECMHYSINAFQQPLDSFKTAITQYAPGMMTHIFFDIESATITHLKVLNPRLTENPQFKAMEKKINQATLKMARIANDLSSLERELYSGVQTNTLLHLCQEELMKPDCQYKFNLSTTLDLYHASHSKEDKKRLASSILETIQTLKIKEKAFSYWNKQLNIIKTCKSQCEIIFPDEKQLQISLETLIKGNTSLLLMYIIMNKIDGAT